MALILRLRMSLVLASSRAAPQVWMVLILVRFFVAVLVDSYRGAGPIYIYISNLRRRTVGSYRGAGPRPH
jgi:hypothetical protein